MEKAMMRNEERNVADHFGAFGDESQCWWDGDSLPAAANQNTWRNAA